MDLMWLVRVGVSCRGLGTWKNPDHLVYFTTAEISRSSLAPPPEFQFPTGRLFSRQNFKVLWQLLQKSQRKETATGADELEVEKGSG